VAEAADAAGHTAVTLHGLNEGAVVVVLITHGLSTVAALHQTVVGVVNEAAVDRAVRGAVAHGVISEGLGAGAKQPASIPRDLSQALFGIVGIALRHGVAARLGRVRHHLLTQLLTQSES